MSIRLPAWYKGNVPWLLAARAVRSFLQAMLVIVVPLYVSAADYSTLQVGYLLSIALAGSTGLTVIVGIFSDRYGRRLMMMVIAGLTAVGAAVFTLTTQFWVLSSMAALASVRGGGAGSGGGFGAFYPAEQALVASSSPDRERNAVFSMLSLIGVLAGAAGSIVAVLPGLLREHFNFSAVDSYHPVFWIASISSLAVILLCLPIQEKRIVPVKTKKSGAKISTRKLIGRLWLTNSINGFVIGVVGPFMTYWLAFRYGVGSTEIAVLYFVANLLTAFSYVVAPRVAHRLGSVQAIVFTRSATVIFMAGMALAPTFLLASLSYTLRIIINSIGMPIRQSFVMGVAEEERRSTVAAMGSLPAQATSMITPTIASHLIQSVSQAAPIWMATTALAINAGLFELFFKNVRPPEEE